MIAGQGNGPLAPEPLELGMMIGANNAPAMDWVGAQLLAYNPEKIPLVRHAFEPFQWPISKQSSSRVHLVGDLGTGSPKDVLDPIRTRVSHPLGWIDANAGTLPGQADGAEDNPFAAASVESQDA